MERLVEAELRLIGGDHRFDALLTKTTGGHELTECFANRVSTGAEPGNEEIDTRRSPHHDEKTGRSGAGCVLSSDPRATCNAGAHHPPYTRRDRVTGGSVPNHDVDLEAAHLRIADGSL